VWLWQVCTSRLVARGEARDRLEQRFRFARAEELPAERQTERRREVDGGKYGGHVPWSAQRARRLRIARRLKGAAGGESSFARARSTEYTRVVTRVAQKPLRLAGAAGLLVVACGGESRLRDAAGSAGAPAGTGGFGGGVAGAASGTSGGGGVMSGVVGSGGVSGVGGSGASAGSAPACTGVPRPNIYPTNCATSCGARLDTVTSIVCVDGAWGCDRGLVRAWECPEDSCVRGSDHYCCDAHGQATQVVCSDAGTVEACTGDAVNIERRTLCAPADVNIQSCHELDTKPCSSIADHCALAGSCSEECDCRDDGNGPHWACYTPLC
jgi:hypothetical protein